MVSVVDLKSTIVPHHFPPPLFVSNSSYPLAITLAGHGVPWWYESNLHYWGQWALDNWPPSRVAARIHPQPLFQWVNRAPRGIQADRLSPTLIFDWLHLLRGALPPPGISINFLCRSGDSLSCLLAPGNKESHRPWEQPLSLPQWYSRYILALAKLPKRHCNFSVRIHCFLLDETTISITVSITSVIGF